MGGGTDDSAPDDLWHLTLDDLLVEPGEIAAIGGSGPYVITLSSSTAPLSIPPSGLLNFEHLHVFQIQHRENGQLRYRLRLGPITTELEADVVLASVREHYPRAWMASADEDDIRALELKNNRTSRTAAPKVPAPKGPAPVSSVARPSVPPVPPAAEQRPHVERDPAKSPALPSARAASPPKRPPSEAEQQAALRELAAAVLSISDPVECPAPRQEAARQVTRSESPAAPVEIVADPIPVATRTEPPAKPAVALADPAPVATRAKPVAAPASTAADLFPIAARGAPPVPPSVMQPEAPRPSGLAIRQAYAMMRPAKDMRSDGPPLSAFSDDRVTATVTVEPPAAFASAPAAVATPVSPSAPAGQPRPSVAPVTKHSKPVPRLDVPVLGASARVSDAPRTSKPPAAARAPCVASALIGSLAEPAAPPPVLAVPPPATVPSAPPPAQVCSAPIAPPKPASAPPAGDQAAASVPTRLALAAPPIAVAPLAAANVAPLAPVEAESPAPAILSSELSLLESTPPAAVKAGPSVPPVEAESLEPAILSSELSLLESAPPAAVKAAPLVPPVEAESPASTLLASELSLLEPMPPASAKAEPPVPPAEPAAPEPAPSAAAFSLADAASPMPWRTVDFVPPVAAVGTAPSALPPIEFEMDLVLEDALSIPGIDAAAPERVLTAASAPAAIAPIAISVPTVAIAPTSVAPPLPTSAIPPPRAAHGARSTSPAKAIPPAGASRVLAPRSVVKATVRSAPPAVSRASAAKPASRMPTLPPAPPKISPAARPAAMPAAIAKSNAPPPAAIQQKPVPALDKTQTLRALTPLELADDVASRLFVIQLVVSESEFSPESVPNLGIFDEYRLYAAVGLDGDKIRHALRLGFFTDEGAAAAVAGYLRGHFEGAAVKRVSEAERARFADRRLEARKDAGSTGVHAAIELSCPDPVPTTRLAELSRKK